MDKEQKSADRYKWRKKQVAEYLDHSQRWVGMQLRSAWPPPGVKLGGRWVFDKEDIDAWVHLKFALGRAYGDQVKKRQVEEDGE